MTTWRAIRVLTGILGALVLVVSGAYLLLYLYRWEWNRAVVSGLFFLSALVTLSTALLLRALRQTDERIARIEGAQLRAERTRDLIARSNAEAAGRHFEWLRDEASGSRLSVFIPVLLGAGALLTGATYLIERLAGAVAGATIDRRTVRLLTPDLPLGAQAPLTRTRTASAPGVVGDPLLDGFSGAGGESPMAVARRAVVVVVVIGLLGAGVAVLRDATQSRPEPGTAGGATTLVLEVDQRHTPRPLPQVAEALWIACRARLAPTTELTTVERISDRRVRIEVSQGMGPLRERRFIGCLEDATLDLVSARVVSIAHVG